MARSKKRAPANVTLAPDKFRSLVLDKLRADIQQKRAALELAQRVPISDLASMGYWKKIYWKHGYWKMGHRAMIAEETTIPAAPAVVAVAKARKKRVK